MKLTVTIPDEQVERLTTAVCENYSYKKTLEDDKGFPIANPVTPAEFLKSKIVEFLKSHVAAHEIKVATEAAHKNVVSIEVS